MEPYPWKDDVEWLAVDRQGFVGVFTTGGSGPIPHTFLRAPGLLERVHDAIWSLPEISKGTLLVTLPSPDDYSAFARRGLFAFDWADVERTADFSNRYELHAQPDAPARLADFGWPAELLQSIAAVTSPTLDFRQTRVDVQDLDCARPP